MQEKFQRLYLNFRSLSYVAQFGKICSIDTGSKKSLEHQQQCTEFYDRTNVLYTWCGWMFLMESNALSKALRNMKKSVPIEHQSWGVFADKKVCLPLLSPHPYSVGIISTHHNVILGPLTALSSIMERAEKRLCCWKTSWRTVVVLCARIHRFLIHLLETNSISS